MNALLMEIVDSDPLEEEVLPEIARPFQPLTRTKLFLL
jgi:hypothetical protein